jgi:ketosteroid isomerase-like protein
MSQENVEVTKKAIEARNDGDLDLVLSLMTEDVVIDASRRVMDPFVAAGQDEVRRALAMLDEVWVDQRVEAEAWRDVGDAVVVAIRLTNRGRGSGVPVGARSAWLMSLRGDRVSRLVVYQTWEDALEAAGLSE